MFGLANLSDKYVFIIAGFKNLISLKSVSRYDIANNRWGHMPELNQARFSANACSFKDKIYVFGGRDYATTVNISFLNSIEKLNNPFLTMGEASWQLIQPPISIFSPCHQSVVVPLNAN